MKNCKAKKVNKDFVPKVDENGNRYIPVTVRDENSILSTFSPKGSPTISGEFAEFLDSQYTEMSRKEKLRIDIDCDTIDDEEKVLYAGAIRSYYSAEKLRKRNELVRDNVVSLIMLIIGVLVLTASVLLRVFQNEIVGEVIDIIAWVFVWESVDLFFIHRHSLLKECIKCEHFINAEITYSAQDK
jgi:hypothetical protein